MSEKRNVKLIYQYDGSKFSGFQRQKRERTVQGEIEKTIERVFSQKISMVSSGRTDKGVHAIEQVSNFIIDRNIPLESIKRQLNRKLGKEIKIIHVEEVSMKFNARFDAKKRIYMYVLKKEEYITPFESSYVTGIKEDIDVKKLENIMDHYIGKHNFGSFMKKDKKEKNTVREIYWIKCEQNKNEKRIYIKICGNSFLKTMVRIMTGSALAVYSGNKEENYIKDKLKNPDANGSKILISSEGLYLFKVEY